MKQLQGWCTQGPPASEIGGSSITRDTWSLTLQVRGGVPFQGSHQNSSMTPGHGIPIRTSKNPNSIQVHRMGPPTHPACWAEHL